MPFLSQQVLDSLSNWPVLSTPESIEEYVAKNKSIGAE